jgi:hypothetical protein
VLLQQLALLDVPWGRALAANSRGSFKEVWLLRWQPEFAGTLIGHSPLGNSIQDAARAKLLALAEQSSNLAALSELLLRALHSELLTALPLLLQRFDHVAAGSADVRQMLDALPNIVDLARYGDVRGTDTQAVARVRAHLLERACAGLVLAASNLSDEASAQLRLALERADTAISKLTESDNAGWVRALLQLADHQGASDLLRGRTVRMLFDRANMDIDAVGLRLSQALSPHVASNQCAFIEGLLAGSALLLLHQKTLLALIDQWLCALSETHFVEILPLLRRAFANFTIPERQQIASGLATAGTASKNTKRTKETTAELTAESVQQALIAIDLIYGYSS